VSDAREELRDLTAAFRRHLEVRGRCGLVGVSTRKSPVVGTPEGFPNEARGERPSSARPGPSREGLETLPGFPKADDEPLTPYPTIAPCALPEAKVTVVPVGVLLVEDVVLPPLLVPALDTLPG